jgi:nucleotide-binding universal stress UspA family protein
MRATLGVETELLHCVDFPADIALHRLPNATSAIEDYHKAVIEEAEKQIDALIGPDRKGWRVDVIDDWVVRVAPKVADAHDADLLVLTSTAKEGLAGKLLGSTASKLLGKTTRSTFIHRRPATGG